MLCGEFLLHAPCSFMWGVSLTRPMLYYVGSFSYTPHAIIMWGFSCTHPSLFLLENRQINARTKSVGWSLRTVPQTKPVSWSHGYFALVLAGFSACSLADIGFSVGISTWQTQLVWNRLGTNSRQTEAQSRRDLCAHTISHWSLFHVICLHFSFFVISAFPSDGFILRTVAMIML